MRSMLILLVSRGSLSHAARHINIGRLNDCKKKREQVT
jgi:hypothetical protein